MREPLDLQWMRAALVTPENPWQVVDFYESVDSTNLEALRDPRPWRVVVADHQGAGRGRLARRWEAPPGASIAVSAVVPMPLDRSADWGWLPLLTGMAMRSALAHVAHVVTGLKWPNDVLVQEEAGDAPAREETGDVLVQEGAGVVRVERGAGDVRVQTGAGVLAGQVRRYQPWLKISGVLCEMAPGDGRVVLGAGANIDQERRELPVETATSLALCGARGIRREDVILRYLGALVSLHRRWWEGGEALEALRTEYRSSCLTIGLEVDVHQPDGRVVRGTATGVDDTGRLMVQTAGLSTAHAAGDVVHVRRAQAPAGGTA